jgi:hypothetical protein
MTETKIILYKTLHSLLKQREFVDISIGVETGLQYVKFSTPMEYEENN